MFDNETFIEHSGTPHEGNTPHSGRWPWGSGEQPFQHLSWDDYSKDPKKFLNVERALAKSINPKTGKYYTEKERADKWDCTINELRAYKSMAHSIARSIDEAAAYKLYNDPKSKCYQNASAVGKEMGINESSVRNLLKPALSERNNINQMVCDEIKRQLSEKRVIDVGKGAELYLSNTGNIPAVSDARLDTAIAILQTEGYQKISMKVPQMGTQHETQLELLAMPDVKFSDITKDLSIIQPLGSFSIDAHDKIKPLKYPAYISSDRVKVRYVEEGGAIKDGVIELRPGVPDLDLQGSSYSQVRIGVDDKMYLKGMAVYGDPKDFPPGIDIIFNSNKSEKKGIEGSLKPYKEDGGNNPFGAALMPVSAGGQHEYKDPVTGEMKLSAINKVNDEGNWDGWSRNLASQFLAKQKLPLIKQQLGIALQERRDELEDIISIPQDTIRKKYLYDFADACDAAAMELKGAAMPGQATKVILPVPSLKENECYAPAYENGTILSLIRYPHQGTFEIPTVVVNNKNEEGIRVVGNSADAIGIRPDTAARLSGADFDGDNVICIPNNHGEVTTSKALDGLKDFDGKTAYPAYDGMKRISSSHKGKMMGVVTNLITDMTALHGANIETNDMVDAVKFSMVVIDAEKHNLNWKQAYKDCRIDELMKKYRGIDPATGKTRTGAATIWSRASAEVNGLPERKKYPKINKETGELEWELTGKSEDRWQYQVYDPNTEKMVTKVPKVKPNGEIEMVKANRYNAPGGQWVKIAENVPNTRKSKRMLETNDAYDLVSDRETAGVKERLYADYANDLKAMANEARKIYANTDSSKVDPRAKAIYAEEVASLKVKLNNSLMNTPRERMAQIYANQILRNHKMRDPDITTDNEKLKKAKNEALRQGREMTGAGKQHRQIDITTKEWEAINAGAVNSTTLEKIMANTDSKVLREHVMPKKPENTISKSVQMQIKSMNSRGYTLAEIEKALGVSKSTVSKYIKE